MLVQAGVGESPFDSEDINTAQQTGLLMPLVPVNKLSLTRNRETGTIDGVRVRFVCSEGVAGKVKDLFTWPEERVEHQVGFCMPWHRNFMAVKVGFLYAFA